jgi:hypothetical protein
VYTEEDETRADLALEVTNADGERKIDGSATVVVP